MKFNNVKLYSWTSGLRYMKKPLLIISIISMGFNSILVSSLKDMDATVEKIRSGSDRYKFEELTREVGTMKSEIVSYKDQLLKMQLGVTSLEIDTSSPEVEQIKFPAHKLMNSVINVCPADISIVLFEGSIDGVSFSSQNILDSTIKDIEAVNSGEVIIEGTSPETPPVEPMPEQTPEQVNESVASGDGTDELAAEEAALQSNYRPKPTPPTPEDPSRPGSRVRSDETNIDPETGLPIEPEIDPETGLPIEPEIDPETGLPIEQMKESIKATIADSTFKLRGVTQNKASVSKFINSLSKNEFAEYKVNAIEGYTVNESTLYIFDLEMIRKAG